MRGDRLRATHYCRVLTQTWLLGASRFFILFSVFRVLRLGRCVDSLYCSWAGLLLRVEFASAPLPGASTTCSSCWTEKSQFLPGSIYGGLSALARGYSHGVTLFQHLAGLLDSFTFFVSPRYRLKVELMRQGRLKVSGP